MQLWGKIHEFKMDSNDNEEKNKNKCASCRLKGQFIENIFSLSGI